MEQEELMKSSFDSNIGTIGSNGNTSSIDESLKEIISKLDEINNTIKGVYNLEEKNEQVIESNEVEIPEETPVIEEPIIEATTEPVVDNSNVSQEEPVISVVPTVENENITPVVEETSVEDTFTPVEAPVSIEEPKEENSNVISMDELLSSMNEASEKPVEEPLDAVVPLTYEEPKETIAPVVNEEIKPVVEETPIVEESKPIETPVVAEEIKPAVESTPIIEEPKVETPVMEDAKPVEEVVAPVVAEEIKPTVEITPVMETSKVEVPVVEETVAPVVAEAPTLVVEEPKVEEPINNKCSIVTPLYVGMSEVKTGNDPHRVIAIADNNAFNKKQSEEKALVMNKIA